MWFTLNPRMIVSSRAGWARVRTGHPSVTQLFFALVLPFSLIPAIMLLYAGYNHGQMLVPDTTVMQWQIAALVFLLAELISVPTMASLLRDVLGEYPPFDEYYALAAYAAIPLWLSSFGLLSSNLFLVVTIATIGLVASFLTLYHGLKAFFGRQEEEVAFQYLAYKVLAAGLIGWLLLTAFLAVMLGIIP
jgi:DMSO/TMAO reductase YedYZ heme-binding membrane subunit